MESRFTTFLVVWFGQLVSNIGSSLTSFALGFWVYQETGSATRLALVIVAARTPMLLISPFAGTLVDRWSRRRAMIVADAGAALGTLVTAVLLATGRLEIWHLYLTLGFAGVFGAFQTPAYTSATTLLVPKRHFGRAAGLVQLAGSVGLVLGPSLGATLLITTGLTTIFVIDLVTFLVAVLTLLAVRFPEQAISRDPGHSRLALWSETKEGLGFVASHRGLLGLLTASSLTSFAIAFHAVLIYPLLLGFAPATTAGAAISAGAFGMVLGSVVMSAWGGPRRRVAGTLGALMIAGAGYGLAGLRPSVALAAGGLFVLLVFLPIADGTARAIWQTKVPPHLQGRVFALQAMLGLAATPLAYLLAGPLADMVFEPLLAAGGPLAGTVGRLMGTGPGRGVGLLFVVLGLVTMLVAATALASTRVRRLESEIPDAIPEAPGTTAAPQAAAVSP
ncbi:MAG: MFS transporter [Acidimicrobiia bacterium]|jgi:hypothetical protein